MNTMPLDMIMYWTDIDDGDWDTPPVAAPIWEHCDEEEAPEHMTCADSDGLVILDVWRADDESAHIDDSLRNGDFMNNPVIKQLGGPDATVTNFNPETGTMDFVRGTKHFTLEAGELAFLLAHLHTLKDDIYEVRNRKFERTLHLVK